MKDLGTPLTAYYNILKIAVPGRDLTITKSSIIFVSLESFMVPCGKIKSFRMHPEFKKAMSVS